MNGRSLLMPSGKFTSEDYWNMPEGTRTELIDGRLYAMAPPSLAHQRLAFKIAVSMENFISMKGGNCKVVPAPFAVNLDGEDDNWVEPDISVICDPSMLSDKGCIGAPDMVVEVVSPSNRHHDYGVKCPLYCLYGVEEIWIVDIEKGKSTVFRSAEDYAPVIYPQDAAIPCGILDGLSINIAGLKD